MHIGIYIYLRTVSVVVVLSYVVQLTPKTLNAVFRVGGENFFETTGPIDLKFSHDFLTIIFFK